MPTTLTSYAHAIHAAGQLREALADALDEAATLSAISTIDDAFRSALSASAYLAPLSSGAILMRWSQKVRAKREALIASFPREVCS